MAQYWTYGLNDQGEPQLLGPFEDEGEAQDAGAELNRVQVVYAPNRNAAITQLQRTEQRGRRTEKPWEPEPQGRFDREFNNLERGLENTMAEMEAEGAEL